MSDLGDRLVGSLAVLILAAWGGAIGNDLYRASKALYCPERLEDGRSLIRTHFDASGALIGCSYQPRQSELLDYEPVELRRIANMRERMNKTRGTK